MIPEYRMRLKEIEGRIEGDLKPLWGKLRTVDDIRFLLDLVKMQQAEIELLRRKVDKECFGYDHPNFNRKHLRKSH